MTSFTSSAEVCWKCLHHFLAEDAVLLHGFLQKAKDLAHDFLQFVELQL